MLQQVDHPGEIGSGQIGSVFNTEAYVFTNLHPLGIQAKDVAGVTIDVRPSRAIDSGPSKFDPGITILQDPMTGGHRIF
jgi:hypothetical protein